MKKGTPIPEIYQAKAKAKGKCASAPLTEKY